MVLEIDFSRLDAQDVLDVAIDVEKEAEENYEQLAGWMSADGNDEVARFFTKMAGLERLHRDQIAEHRHALFGDAPARHSSRAVWEVEQPEYGEIDGEMSLEKAFDVAMDAERRAGEYYANALDYASDPQVVTLFQRLRDSEAEHLRLLREQRERAFGPSDT
jgi:rubrerythrin